MHKNILILGVGSPFGADRLGWQAVAALEQLSLSERFPHLDIRFEQSDRPGSRLLTLLGRADVALIVDAMHSGAPAGSVRRFAVEELNAESGLMSTHGFGVADALALGRALDGTAGGGLPAEIVVLGIEMTAMANGEAVMPELLDELYVAVETVLENMR